MKNRDLQATWNYHNGTKHSYESIRANAHYLDFENQPTPLKIYSDLPAIPLPEHLSSAGVTALDAISITETRPDGSVIPTIQTLAEILYLSAGITKRRSYPGGEMLFRAAACTGALYHIDLYLACGEISDLPAGVYQFSPQDFALRRLRAGDYRKALADASGNETAVMNAPAVVIFASTYWRNAWKYQARAYRHCYWDTGTILANFLAAAAARRVPARIVLGFVDSTVSQLIGLDAAKEGTIALAALGSNGDKTSSVSAGMEPLRLETAPLSKSEVDYPAIREMHEASSLDSAQEVSEWRQAPSARSESPATSRATAEHLIPLQSLPDDQLPTESLETVIQRRGSTRQFSRDPISFAELSTLLNRATGDISSDFMGSTEPLLNDLYLIVHAVDGLAPGAYVFHKGGSALELLKEGNFRHDAGYLGLGQEIPADCSVDVFFLTDLKSVLSRLGNRGYRAAQLEASIMGGKLYLAAYALGLGASGLTFFDDDVTEFFSPHSAGKSVMFLIAIGKSVRRRKT